MERAAPSPDAPTLLSFVREATEPGATVHTGESPSHAGPKRDVREAGGPGPGARS